MSKTISIPSPVSKKLALVMQLSGLLWLVWAVFVGVLWISGEVPELRQSSCITSFILFFCIPCAVRLICFPGSLNERRTRLLMERQRALEQGDPTVYVEKSSPPDLVRMSLLFGLLAAVALPIVFGPLAIVTGIPGAARGYWMAWIGILLAICGLVVWGAFVLYSGLG
jgi:hypothetical protein